MAALYAEFARRQGWLTADRLLTGEEYTQLRATADGRDAPWPPEQKEPVLIAVRHGGGKGCDDAGIPVLTSPADHSGERSDMMPW